MKKLLSLITIVYLIVAIVTIWLQNSNNYWMYLILILMFVCIFRMIMLYVATKIRFKECVIETSRKDCDKKFHMQVEKLLLMYENNFSRFDFLHICFSNNEEKLKSFHNYVYFVELNKMKRIKKFTGILNGQYYCNNDLITENWCGRIRLNFKYEYIWKRNILK